MHAQNNTNKIILKNGWAIQSSAKINDPGNIISIPNYNVSNWYPTIMPSTILMTLVNNKIVKNPYYGNNLAELDGYFSDNNYLYNLPENSPYAVPWWFRTEFELPLESNSNIWLNLSSINYKANIWLNGVLIADTNQIEGAHRLYELDITNRIIKGSKNCLALEITPPIKGTDLSIRWMQGSRTVPDKNGGIWYDVKISQNGELKIQQPHIITNLNLPDTTHAYIKISANILNQSKKNNYGILKGIIKPVNNLAEGGNSQGGQEVYTFEKKVFIKSNSSTKVTTTLEINNPNLWWPHGAGHQNLYNLDLTLILNKKDISDRKNIQFGVREISSYLKDFEYTKNHLVRIYKINGKNIFIKGGNWTQTLMMEDDPKRNEDEIKHMINMNFNAIRTEGFWGSTTFFDLCDKYGIMIFDGFNCCSIWEKWDLWTDRSFEIAGKSFRDQVIRKRNHPSFINWLLGSDNPVPPKVEKMYVDIIEKYDGTRPYQSNAMYSTTSISGTTGLDHDPYPETYTYLPPSTWYGMKPKDKNGNFGTYEFFEFNTEVGPGGEMIPPIESMKKMLPIEDLWPPNNSWKMRYSPDSLSIPGTNAFFNRYGQPTNIESYTFWAQVFQKEAFRAMTEAFRKNKYKSSGILIYRLNAGWPSFSFYLYDYYLRPGGAYTGVQQGFEPLHILYTYDDHSIIVVNDLYKKFKDLTAIIKLFNIDMSEKFSYVKTINIEADDVTKVIKIPKIKDISPIYFLNLELIDAQKKSISSNFYWLSTQNDENAVFTDLNKLPPSRINLSAKYLNKQSNSVIKLKIHNPTTELAFFINPKILIGKHGKELLPSYWNAKYFSILPMETKEIEVKFNAEFLNGNKPYVMLDGLNIPPIEIALDEANNLVTPQLSYTDFSFTRSKKGKNMYNFSITVNNTSKSGNALLKSSQYLYIDNKLISNKRIALASGENKILSWTSIEIKKLGAHIIKIGLNKPFFITID